MAKRRFLKKDIGYIAGDLFTEVLICRTLMPDTDSAEADGLMSRILAMQDEFIRRAQRPDGNGDRKHVRAYYRKLWADLEAEADAIASGIASLNGKG
ncbi:MAG: hypothetical protein LIP00_11045 [Parabacteroides sp.]|nr:hypothetical protein [Parabacteroides sp.]